MTTVDIHPLEIPSTLTSADLMMHGPGFFHKKRVTYPTASVLSAADASLSIETMFVWGACTGGCPSPNKTGGLAMRMTPTRLTTFTSLTLGMLNASTNYSLPANACERRKVSLRNKAPATAVHNGDRKERTVASDRDRYSRAK